VLECGKDPGGKKYAEFVPSTLLSLKEKVTGIMAELGHEKKLGGKIVDFPFALPFPLQTLHSPDGYVQDRDQAVATGNAAGGMGRGRTQLFLSQTLRRVICHLFNVRDSLLLYLNFTIASSEKKGLAHSSFKAFRLLLNTFTTCKLQRAVGITH